METKQSKTDKIFLLVKDDESKVQIAVGNNIVSAKKFDTYKQAEEYIGRKPYELIFNTCYCITQNFIKNEKIQTTDKNPQSIQKTCED